MIHSKEKDPEEILRNYAKMPQININVAVQNKDILSDAAREGRKYGYEMKEIYSPIGRPARKAYSLFPVIDSMGKGFEYIDELLKASFQDGINIGDDEYLEKTVTNLSLDWSEIKKDVIFLD